MMQASQRKLAKDGSPVTSEAQLKPIHTVDEHAVAQADGSRHNAEFILSRFVRAIGSAHDAEYTYLDPETGRQFEMRQDETFDDDGKASTSIFMCEYQPNGMTHVKRGKAAGFVRDERLLELWAKVGPNGFRNALATLGLEEDNVVYVADGYSVASIHHVSLKSCAQAILSAIHANTEYESSAPLTEQEKIKLDRRTAQWSHAYASADASAQQAADAKQGLFNGCRSMSGPLDSATKERILAYLNAPTQAEWLQIRSTVVTGHGTLWQAWCQHDESAPRSGNKGYPRRATLIEAIRTAVDKRREDVAERLAQSRPRGLRAV